MARRERSQSVFLRHDGQIRKDVYFRINPTAIRFQQQAKANVQETLGGYYREVIQAADRQVNGLMLPDFTIESTTGIAYRNELKTIDWIWRHASDRKKDGSPADTYFFDNIADGPFQGIQRSAKRAYLIHIQNFAWDDSVGSFQEIKFSMRCKVLRDLFWGLEGETDLPNNIPNLNSLLQTVNLRSFDPNRLRDPLGDITTLPPARFTRLPLQ